MKKLKASRFLVPILVVIILILLSYILIKNNTSRNTEGVKTTEPTPITEAEKPVAKVVDKSLYEEKSYTEPTRYATFKVFYPQFKNASAKFNEEIEDLVVRKIESHKKDSENILGERYENQLPGEDTTEFPTEEEKFSFDVSWKPTQVNDKFISFILIVSGYTGGAHGYENLASFNYDVVNKKEITLADLFLGDQDYLKTISEFSRKDLQAQFHKSLNVKTKEDEVNFKDSIMPMLLNGTMPAPENFSIFTFTTNSITFYFAQYQVGPYTMGEPKVTIPRK